MEVEVEVAEAVAPLVPVGPRAADSATAAMRPASALVPVRAPAQAQTPARELAGQPPIPFGTRTAIETATEKETKTSIGTATATAIAIIS